MAIILEENLLKVKDRGEPVEIVYPEDGVIIVPSPIGILKTTQNPEAAKAVVDWWLSPEGQKAIVTGWMHSVRTDVQSPKGAKPLAEFAPAPWRSTGTTWRPAPVRSRTSSWRSWGTEHAIPRFESKSVAIALAVAVLLLFGIFPIVLLVINASSSTATSAWATSARSTPTSRT